MSSTQDAAAEADEELDIGVNTEVEAEQLTEE